MVSAHSYGAFAEVEGETGERGGPLRGRRRREEEEAVLCLFYLSDVVF